MLAEDVVQDSFEKIWRKRNAIELDTIKGLLFRLVHNNIMDVYRKKKLKNGYDLTYNGESFKGQMNFEIVDVLDHAFVQQSNLSKSLILLRDYEGYSYEEISEILEISLSKVKVYLYRARKSMQTAIQSLEFEYNN